MSALPADPNGWQIFLTPQGWWQAESKSTGDKLEPQQTKQAAVDAIVAVDPDVIL